MKRAALLISLAAIGAIAATQTSPRQQFGQDLGADYFLANYQQLTEYWKKLDRESDRFTVVSIGKTAEGRDQYMAIVTDPANHRDLARYKDIAKRLAKADGLTTEQARDLARDGKSVVWIDGGLHASEVLCAQALMEMGWQLVSRNDDETKRILRDVIVLLVHANPDGHDLLADWYMRKPVETERSTGGVPRLYQKYIGHDNNRDFFMSAMPETENMNRTMYREWFPQIMYNHHQTGPAGTVMFAPPFRDPFPYEVDPLARTGLEMVGAVMHNRFIAEDKRGVTMRSGAGYSAWWNGGLRTTAYYHNMIGILTETIGSPTPMRIPFIAGRQMPSADLPKPIDPQEWHFRQSVDYSITANYAILDYASRFRETILFNIWRMGMNSIERGSTDTWTPNPRKITAARSIADLRKPEERDARAFVIPSDQPDFGTATKFVHALIETGIDVQRADRSFTINGKQYPSGSYIVRMDQAFRPHVYSMFEPQVHPDDIRFPGAAPTAPYDSAGWTLAYSMGVQFDRVLDPFDATFPVLTDHPTPNLTTTLSASAAGYFIDGRVNDAFTAANRVRNAGVGTYRVIDGPDRGSFFVTAAPASKRILEEMARTHGVRSKSAPAVPEGLQPLPTPRIALLDTYGGSMSSGWTRWLLEQFEFSFNVVYPPDIDNGNLKDYDVLILVDGMGFGGGGNNNARNDTTIPEVWRNRMGSLTSATSLPKVKEFAEGGGTVIAIGSATRVAQQLGLAVANHLTETVDGQTRNLSREKFYVPGSVLRVKVDTTHPLAMGMPEYVDVIFDNSPVFAPNTEQGPIAWFDSETPLRSGWAWGQAALNDGVAAVELPLGQGRVVLFGPEVAFRAQPHGTFKLLFNALQVRKVDVD
ncbi:MAG: M14 family metallopeptidase [Fimbriimonadaceae bacterium]